MRHSAISNLRASATIKVFRVLDRRRERVARHMGWTQPAAAAEPQQTASVPDGWRWPEQAGAEYRGEIHAHHEQAQTSPAWPAQYYLDHAEPQPVPVVEQAAPPRRGFFAALIGGAAAVPAVVEAAPAVPAEWTWPAPAAGSEYRGELHQPQAPAIEHQPQQWQWPAAVPGAANESPPANEHYAASWDAPALPAPDVTGIGWDASEAAWSEPEPSYARLPAPEAEQLSTQAEIDTFIEAAWETAPVLEAEPQPDYDLRALPPPDEEDR